MDEAKNVPMRQKYWSELTSDEKIERMREIVKQVQSQVKRLDHAVTRLTQHQHAQNGEVLSPIDRGYAEAGGIRHNDTDVYF